MPEEKDEFRDAFDEAIGKGASPEVPAEESAPGEKEAQEEEQSEERKETSEGAPEQDPRTEEPEPEPEPGEETKGTADDFEHKYKTLQGMFNSEAKKRKDLEEELGRLRAEKAPSASASSEPSSTPLPAEKATEGEKEPEIIPFDKDEEFRAFREEFPEVADFVAKALKLHNALLTRQLEGVLSAVRPIHEAHQQSAAERHFQVIREAHPDFEQFVNAEKGSGELIDWIESLPAYKKSVYRAVVENGSTADVVDLLSDFKQAKGYGAKEEKKASPPDPAKKQALEGMEAVKTRKTPVSTAAKRGREDFVGAFEEFTSTA
ncbi:MAG: hypothetical protein K8I29_19565 [Alphaproteobacteria bacterium]|uniref:Scaffolding protein n=1 Tax=Candidatus Nitrobium versatile TaxID=2884831 RepID=A0A953M3Q4_9BACT|nr:hypothetical protein [Candidatus Nitrobium versatile]